MSVRGPDRKSPSVWVCSVPRCREIDYWFRRAGRKIISLRPFFIAIFVEVISLPDQTFHRLVSILGPVWLSKWTQGALEVLLVVCHILGNGTCVGSIPGMGYSYFYFCSTSFWFQLITTAFKVCMSLQVVMTEWRNVNLFVRVHSYLIWKRNINCWFIGYFVFFREECIYPSHNG